MGSCPGTANACSCLARRALIRSTVRGRLGEGSDAAANKKSMQRNDFLQTAILFVWGRAQLRTLVSVGVIPEEVQGGMRAQNPQMGTALPLLSPLSKKDGWVVPRSEVSSSPIEMARAQGQAKQAKGNGD